MYSRLQEHKNRSIIEDVKGTMGCKISAPGPAEQNNAGKAVVIELMLQPGCVGGEENGCGAS